MRIKFLSVIISFLVVCIAFSACLDGNDDYTYSSDASVYAFGIDTIYGKHYKFSIDQIERRIFNRDSLPMSADTLLDSIMVDTFTVTGAITTGDMDTLFPVGEYVDLSAAINNPSGIGFKVHAADGFTNRTYKLTINVHQQDPDSLVWREMTSVGGFPSDPLSQGVKLLSMDDYLYMYSYINDVLKAYKANVSNPVAPSWEEITLTGMPQDAVLSSLIVAFESIFVLTESGNVYQSVDGAAWQIVEGLSGEVQALLTTLPETLAGIKQVDGVNYFCTTDASMQWSLGEVVEENFPLKNISSTIHKTSNGVYKSVLVGMPEADVDRVTPWFTMDGSNWASMEPSETNFCPLTDNPSIIYYDGAYYMFDAGLYAFYTSTSGLVWNMMTTKMRFPYVLRDAIGYSAVIDENNFIWIVGGGNSVIENQLWRGRINRLGFDRK